MHTYLPTYLPTYLHTYIHKVTEGLPWGLHFVKMQYNGSEGVHFFYHGSMVCDSSTICSA